MSRIDLKAQIFLALFCATFIVKIYRFPKHQSMYKWKIDFYLPKRLKIYWPVEKLNKNRRRHPQKKFNKTVSQNKQGQVTNPPSYLAMQVHIKVICGL